MRLTGTSVDCYKYLEPLYNDYRKIKTQNRNGGEHLMQRSQYPVVCSLHKKMFNNASLLRV